jgi:adenosylhomocysteinase
MCLHLEFKTAALATAIRAGGAEVAITGCERFTTHDDVAAALVERGISVYAWRGETEDEFYANINRVLDHKPDIIIDDGAPVIVEVHTKRRELLPKIIGATEETTVGVKREKALESEGILRFPVIDVNGAYTKHLFDNRYGTGQSALDGILRATNLLLAGKNVVVAGYGWVGRGVALRARGMGANVIITEVNPIKAIEALMEGFRVMSMKEAAKIGDLFITATGNIDIITKGHFELMKDGAILSNAGHFDVEINLSDLEAISIDKNEVRPHVTEYRLKDGRRLYLLAKGRLVNLVAADGHPTEIMDLSFAGQALATEYLVKHRGKLENKVYDFPYELDVEIARIKLKTLGVEIDTLTESQKAYLRGWRV